MGEGAIDGRNGKYISISHVTRTHLVRLERDIYICVYYLELYLHVGYSMGPAAAFGGNSAFSAVEEHGTLLLMWGDG